MAATGEIMLGEAAGAFAPNVTFAELTRHAADVMNVGGSAEETAAWIERQTSHHQDADEPFIQEFGKKSWQISNRRTDQGGTVAVHADITEIKRISGRAEDRKGGSRSRELKPKAPSWQP